MADNIKKLNIAGVSGDTRNIGAEAQNVDVSYDANGNIITDIESPGIIIDHTESVAQVLLNVPPKNHADNTAQYGMASTTQYGHIRLGTGLDTSNGNTVVKYGTSANTACQGNDSRLSNKRANPQPVTFYGDDNVNTQYDGSSPQSINYSRVGAAPTNHAYSTSKYGIATKNQYGHVKIGEGLENREDALSLSIASRDTIGGVKVDNDTILIDNDGTLHGGGAGGSTIQIYTSESTLFNEEIVITAETGADETSIYFNESGYAVIKGYMGTGNITFVSSNGSQTAEYSLNIPYFGNYAITLAFWSAPITISTSTIEMYGRPIVVKKDGLIIGSTNFSGSGIGSYIAHAPGTYTFECTLGWKTFSSTNLIVSAEEDYSAYIQGFVAKVIISTSVPEFEGATIAVSGSGDVPTSTITFGSDNTAVYMAYERGTYNFSVIYNNESYPFVVNITTEQDYLINATLWTAVVNITTTTDDFFNQTGQVYDDTDTFIGSFTFDNTGKATYKIHKAGTYIFSIAD
mgnify:CR=1 FL=1